MKKPSGYSGKPLATKLGLKEGFRISLFHEPDHYSSLLGNLPSEARLLGPNATNFDLLHVFAKSRGDLARIFPRAKRRIKPNGMLWISWPKKVPGTRTDIDENIVRQIGLANGLVDVKVAAIDENWSGLKFVYRLRDRS